MAFEHILASVRLQENKEPSVYMALCMVQSLFRDIEDEAGAYLSDCELGSEKAAVKLLWLCEQIQDVYRSKMKDLPWDEEIEDALKELTATREKLRSVEGAVNDLAAKREEVATLETRMKSLQEAAKEYHELESTCRQLEQEIAVCRRVNEDELAAMRCSVESLMQERERLLAECETFRAEQIEPLTATVQTLQTQKLALLNSLQELTDSRTKLETERDGLSEAMYANEAQCVSLQKKIRELEDLCAISAEELRKLEALQKDQMATYTARRETETALEEECEIYRKQYLDPVEKRIASLEDEKMRKNEILKGKQDHETNLGERIRGIIEDIEKANAAIYKYEKEIPQQQSVLLSTREDMTQKETELQGLRAEYEELESKLQETKNQIDELEYTLIPKCRADILEDEGQFAQLSVQSEALTKELMQKRARTKEKEDLRNRLQAEYNELEEKCQRADAEIGRLTALRDDLQSKTSEEQVEECKAKLREHTDRLREMLQLAAQMQTDIACKEADCSAAEARCNELSIRHADWIKVETDLKKKQAELQFYGTEGFLEQYRGKKQQLERLETACSGLREAKNLLDTYLGVSEQTSPSPDTLNAQLHRLKMAVDQITATLVHIADNLKWEGKA